MNSPHTPNLLRRTAVAFAAAAGLVFAGTVSAQSVTLTGATANSCTYSSMNVLPNGNVSVTCSGGAVTTPPPPPPPGESFSITTSPSSLPVGASALVLVTRVNPSSGTATINYTVSGGCSPASGVFWIGTARMTEGFQVTAPATSGTCNVAITSDVGVVATPSTSSISITGGTGQPQPGCPAVPNDVLDFDLKLSGADRLVMASGRIASAVLPGVKTSGGTGSSGQILFGESTIAPRAAHIEISVTKCRGVIDTAAGACYLNSSNPTFTKLEWIERTIWGTSTDSVAQAYNLCKAYLTDGPFAVNVRYTYSASDCQYGNCGFVQQWNYDTF